MDTRTTYLGMRLRNPLVVSACQPLTEDVNHVRRLEDGGAGAVVLHSLFEEQITHESETLDHYLSYGEESFAEALSYFPDMDTYNVGPEEYLDLVEASKQAVDIPVIGSLNGVSTGGWIEYARRIEEAGADALELNIYFIPTETEMSGGEVEQMYIDILGDVKEEISIPLAVKLGPYLSSIPQMTHRLARGGADGLVLFNRFYQPDFDLEELEVVPDLQLSRSYDMRLPLRWVAILYGRVSADFSITSGVHSHEDVLKGMMAGAKVTMMASELLRNGTERLEEIRREMARWMEEHEYESVKQMQGSMSQLALGHENASAIERANYTRALHTWRPEPTGKMS